MLSTNSPLETAKALLAGELPLADSLGLKIEYHPSDDTPQLMYVPDSVYLARKALAGDIKPADAALRTLQMLDLTWVPYVLEARAAGRGRSPEIIDFAAYLHSEEHDEKFASGERGLRLRAIDAAIHEALRFIDHLAKNKEPGSPTDFHNDNLFEGCIRLAVEEIEALLLEWDALTEQAV